MGLINSLIFSGNILAKQGARSLINALWAKFYTLKLLPSRVQSYPRWAQVETTNICNLKCAMCAHSSSAWKAEIAPKNLGLDEFEHIINQMPYIQYARISGVGEPLLNPNLIDMIHLCHTRGIRTGFFTNGTLLTPDKSRELLKSEGLIRINVSIDAGDPETYNRIRIGADFSEVCYHIEEFLRIKSELKKNSPNLFVWMIAMHEYIKEIPVLIKTLQKLGLNILILHNVLEGDETIGKQLTGDDKKLLEGYRRAAAEKNFNLTYGRMPEGNINRTDTRTCVDPWNMVYVNVSGWINPCCYSFGDMSTYFGNIYEMPLKKIWNVEPFMRFRQELKYGMPKSCQKCPAHSRATILNYFD